VHLKSKKEAAEALGVSTRAIERAVRRGHLAAQYRPSRHGRMAWFTPQDIARYQALQQARSGFGFSAAGFSSAVMKKPASDAGFTIGTIMPLAPPEDAARRLAPHRREQQDNSVPLNQRLTLSIPEAVELSGLPRQFLLESIQANKLKAVRIGRSLLVKRADLETFVAGL